ncbi:MAG: hypothetical protein VCC01_12590, partial [Candidatus Hydrogenedentota bacterium]
KAYKNKLNNLAASVPPTLGATDKRARKKRYKNNHSQVTETIYPWTLSLISRLHLASLACVGLFL